jgi:hypothetical protein
LIALIAVWLIAAGGGLWVVWAYDNRPGVEADARPQWPAGSRLARATDRPTIVLLAHPRCSCTPASISELAEALARVRTPPRTYVVFLKPSAFGEGWERTALWESASKIPNVTVVRDDDGREAAQFGGATSGQTFLYDGSGVLQFSGGITRSRGHAGENPGRQALVALVERMEGASRRTRVYGCPLFASERER